MKTVIYCNVTTGEAFDADGSPRSLNNPFTAAYGERRIFEWHLVTATSGASPANWTPLTEFEHAPSIASLAADDTYINAYPGRFVSCENSVVQLELDVDDSLIPGKGRLRLTKTDGAVQEIGYTAVTPCAGGYKFHAAETLAASDYLPDGSADLLKQPMAKTSSVCPVQFLRAEFFSFLWRSVRKNSKNSSSMRMWNGLRRAGWSCGLPDWMRRHSAWSSFMRLCR